MKDCIARSHVEFRSHRCSECRVLLQVSWETIKQENRLHSTYFFLDLFTNQGTSISPGTKPWVPPDMTGTTISAWSANKSMVRARRKSPTDRWKSLWFAASCLHSVPLLEASCDQVRSRYRCKWELGEAAYRGQTRWDVSSPWRIMCWYYLSDLWDSEMSVCIDLKWRACAFWTHVLKDRYRK